MLSLGVQVMPRSPGPECAKRGLPSRRNGICTLAACSGESLPDNAPGSDRHPVPYFSGGNARLQIRGGEWNRLKFFGLIGASAHKHEAAGDVHFADFVGHAVVGVELARKRNPVGGVPGLFAQLMPGGLVVG